MRNKKIVHFALIMALLVPFMAFSLVLANDDGPAGMLLRKAQAQLDSRNDENKVEVRTNSETSGEGNLIEARQNRIAGLKRMMEAQIRRAQKAFDRMSNIMKRIKTRRDKLASDGVNVNSVDALITTAQTQLTGVETALAKAKTDLAAVSTSTDPKGAVQTFMATVKDLKKKTVELHRSLSGVVKEMRRVAPKKGEDAKVKETKDNDSEEDETTPTPSPTPTSTNN